LAAGLLEAAKVIQRERLRDPRTRPLLVLVTDGRATDGVDGVARSQQAADYLATLGITTVVVDSESGPMRFGLARQLAVRLGAEHMPVGEVSATALTGATDVHKRGVA
jgi:magnesium chelatase subunit D